MKKREEAAAEEAKLAIQEFESLSKQLNNSETENINTETTSGRRTFGAMKKSAPEPRKKTKSEYYGDTDGEDDTEAREAVEYDGDNNNSSLFADANIGSDILCEDSKKHQNSVFKVGMFHEYFFSLVYFFLFFLRLLNKHFFLFLLRALMKLLEIQVLRQHMKLPFLHLTHGKRLKIHYFIACLIIWSLLKHFLLGKNVYN